MNQSWARPEIKIEKTMSEKFWDMIGYSFFIGSIIFIIYAWGKLPNEVPAHFNMAGEVDRWGSKYELLILPIIGVFSTMMMQALEKFPQAHNYPKRFNEANAEAFYLNSRQLLNVTKNLMLIIFALINLDIVLIALEWGGGFTKWVIPLSLVGFTVPIVSALMKRRHIK